MNWYAIYTYPRWEKKVAQRINDKGLEVYCPLNRVRRKWSDRYKVVQEPLFKSYVFVRINEEDQSVIRNIEGVVNFVFSESRPAIVRDQEIELIRKFLKEYQDIMVSPFRLVKGSKVRVISGVLMDYEGIVVDVKNKTAAVRLGTLGYDLTAHFELSGLEPL